MNNKEQELLDESDKDETKKKVIVVDATDNNVLEPKQGEGEEIYPMVPPPPGAIDPNATGIPDNARKTEIIQKSLDRKKLTHMKAMDNGMIHVKMTATLTRTKESDLDRIVVGDTPITQKGYMVTEKDLPFINADSIPEGSICCNIQACDLNVDRGFERFTDNALSSFTKVYPGKPILLDHNWSARDTVGKILYGVNSQGALVLRGFVPNTPSNSWVVDNIKSGIFTMVSVGFASAPEDMLCSACDQPITLSMCPHEPGDVLKDGSRVNLIYKDVIDAFELSIIPVPMQPGSHIKSAYPDHLVFDGVLKDLGTAMTRAVHEAFKDENNSVDIINLGIDTNKDSLSMSEQVTKESENLSGIEHPSEGGFNDPSDLTKKDGEGVPAETKADEDISKAEDIATPAPELKGKEPDEDDMEKSLTEIKESIKALNARFDSCEKMWGEIRSMSADINEKCSGFSTAISKSTPEAETKTESVDMQKALDETNHKFAEALTLINKKLDVAMTASTEGLKRLLLEENVTGSSTPVPAKKSLWINEYFGLNENDLGGQK